MDSFDINILSEQILLKVKMQEDSSSIQSQLEELETSTIVSSLTSDEKKKAFWINIYNAYYQILRKEKNISKPDIYKKKLFTIANKMFSLDDVEHGILRKYRYKYSIGLFANLLAPKFIKEIAVEEIDYRIHFALNCGAKSCPPIAFYNHEKINAQLDTATQAFLEGESIFDDEKKVVHTTALFKWFSADFGGTDGIREIFKKQLDKNISDYKIKYKEYSWEEQLDNFSS